MTARSPETLQLPPDVEQCHALIGELVKDIAKYQHQIEWLQRRMFGRSSERIDPSELTFFGEKAASEQPEPVQSAPPPAASVEVKAHRRNGRKPLPAELPRKRIEHDLSPEEKCCPDCGAERRRIGEDVSEQLEYIPASFYVIEHARPKYACARCQGHVAQSAMPPQPIDKGLAGPGLLAHVVVGKYCDHLPLNRQERILARHGVNLSRKTLCDWAMGCAGALAPVARAMRAEVLKSAVIQTDDTPVPVQDAGRTHRAFLWVYRGDESHPYDLYDFTWTRGRDGPEKFLEDYEGWLQADAYAGYDQLYAGGKIVEVGCWAHARRKFFDAKSSSHVLANQALVRIKEFYAVEREAAELDDAARLALRREKSAPLLDEFHAWLASIQPGALPKSPMGQAIQYSLNNWRALTRYLDSGALAIDNNAAERALRHVVIGRKNWLFAGSQRGGHAAAVLYSLIASARRNGLDPFAYLRDLLSRIATHPQRRIEEFFPDNWKKSQTQEN